MDNPKNDQIFNHNPTQQREKNKSIDAITVHLVPTKDFSHVITAGIEQHQSKCKKKTRVAPDGANAEDVTLVIEEI